MFIVQNLYIGHSFLSFRVCSTCIAVARNAAGEPSQAHVQISSSLPGSCMRSRLAYPLHESNCSKPWETKQIKDIKGRPVCRKMLKKTMISLNPGYKFQVLGSLLHSHLETNTGRRVLRSYAMCRRSQNLMFEWVQFLSSLIIMFFCLMSIYDYYILLLYVTLTTAIII